MRDILKDFQLWLPFLVKKPVFLKHFLHWRKFKYDGSSPLDQGIPWITYHAREWLGSFLRKEMVVFEWGSGGSTLFIFERARELVSVEHDPDWYKKVSNLIAKDLRNNCEYILEEPLYKGNKGTKKLIPGGYFSSSNECETLKFENYCKAIEKFPENYFDLVIVDGRARVSCIYHALNKVKRDGFLMLDNSERDEYVPGVNLLKNWKRKDFFGPGPFNPYFWQTSIFQKPASK